MKTGKPANDNAATERVYEDPIDYYKALRSGEASWRKAGGSAVQIVLSYYRLTLPEHRVARAQALLLKLWASRVKAEAYVIGFTQQAESTRMMLQIIDNQVLTDMEEMKKKVEK